MKLKLDLHDIYGRGDEIERALRAVIDEAIEKKARLVEIIPGKGSGQLKKRVLRSLDRKDIKGLYRHFTVDRGRAVTQAARGPAEMGVVETSIQ